ncbi:MAG: sulfurtransferase [Pseudomonadota bacterium]
MSEFLTHEDVATFDGVILDCRFDLADAESGRRQFEAKHIPGAYHIDLERHLSASTQRPVQDPTAVLSGIYAGRHPLPTPSQFLNTLASFGIGPSTNVLLYDDSRFAFAARCWWMMTSIGYQRPKLLDGGFKAWCKAGFPCEQGASTPTPLPVAAEGLPELQSWSGCCDRVEMLERVASGSLLVDSRDPQRYRGEFEPIDPVAGHIPGALNQPWQAFTNDKGYRRSTSELVDQWESLADQDEAVVYCGSGVTACVNVLSRELAGKPRPILYAGSWSDWCSHLDSDEQS